MLRLWVYDINMTWCVWHKVKENNILKFSKSLNDHAALDSIAAALSLLFIASPAEWVRAEHHWSTNIQKNHSFLPLDELHSSPSKQNHTHKNDRNNRCNSWSSTELPGRQHATTTGLKSNVPEQKRKSYETMEVFAGVTYLQKNCMITILSDSFHRKWTGWGCWLHTTGPTI